MPDPRTEPRPVDRTHEVRIWGSVRFRITVAVTVLFAVGLTITALLLVQRVEGVLVGNVYERDEQSLLQLRDALASGAPSPQVLRPVSARLGTEFQVVDPDGQVRAKTPGAPDVPFAEVPPPPGSDQAGRPPDGQPTPSAPVPTRPNGRPVPTRPDGAPALRPGQGQGQGQGQGGGNPNLPLPPVAQPAVAPSTTVVAAPASLTGAAAEGDYAVTALPAATRDGPVTLLAATSLAGVEDSVAALTRALWLTIPALVALIGATALIMTGRALRPVEDITQRVEEIRTSTLHERVPVPASRDEVAHLARTMNDMLARLDHGVQRQRRFVSDASHELRTPVASIRTELEVALLHPDRADWGAVARNVLAEDDRLEQIVADLLLLARFDERPDLPPDQLGEVDLDDVVRTEAARTRRLPVGTTAVQHARVAGRADELARMVGHLLDNAARHAAARVEVEVEPAGGVVLLRVDDDGPGIPPDDRVRVFERFGRLDEGRARDAGGTGLGLAVVRGIATRHHGTVTVLDSPLGGARVEVLLPRLAVDAPVR